MVTKYTTAFLYNTETITKTTQNEKTSTQFQTSYKTTISNIYVHTTRTQPTFVTTTIYTTKYVLSTHETVQVTTMFQPLYVTDFKDKTVVEFKPEEVPEYVTHTKTIDVFTTHCPKLEYDSPDQEYQEALGDASINLVTHVQT